jgi:hypothetical protein
MQERQARGLSEFRDTVWVGSDLATVCALRAWLAEREPVPYALSPWPKRCLSQPPPRLPVHNKRRAGTGL